MKKFLLVAVLAMCSVLIVRADNEQVIEFNQLPESAQAIVNAHFDAALLSFCTVEREGRGKEYEVRFTDGVELSFDTDGSLRKVDCQSRAVPEALVPEVVRAQVAKRFPNAVIVEWGKDDRGWKAELDNRLEMKFNRKLEFVGLDD